MIQFNATVSMLDSSVYGYHLPVPLDIADQFKNTDRRMICIFNKSVKHNCALMSSGKGTYMITLHQAIRKKLNIDLGDLVKVEMKKDDSDYGMPLPDELFELWQIDPDANQLFHQLTKGKQRSLIYIISQGKRPETRIKKAVAILEYLKTVNGKLNFKEMHQFIKNYNSL